MINKLAYFLIINKLSGKALDGGGDDGTKVYPNPNVSSDNNWQNWEITSAIQVLSKTQEDEGSSVMAITEQDFKVAFSFSGIYRTYVSEVAEQLAKELGKEKVFYDEYYEYILAQPNLDLLLQDIYSKQTELIVVFIGKHYNNSEWCGLEWAAIRDLKKRKQSQRIMPVRMDDGEVPGLFSIDGYIDVKNRASSEVASLIIQRLNSNSLKGKRDTIKLEQLSEEETPILKINHSVVEKRTGDFSKEFTERLLATLKGLLQIQGPINEGKDGSRGDFFGTGDTYESTTWPKEVQLIPTDEREGLIRVSYDCMVRHKHFIAQAETATKDNQHPAIVTARYSIDQNSIVHISAINFEGHQARRCGKSIRERLEATNGKKLI